MSYWTYNYGVNLYLNRISLYNAQVIVLYNLYCTVLYDVKNKYYDVIHTYADFKNTNFCGG